MTPTLGIVIALIGWVGVLVIVVGILRAGRDSE